jgi:hypothetical protein
MLTSSSFATSPPCKSILYPLSRKAANLTPALKCCTTIYQSSEPAIIKNAAKKNNIQGNVLLHSFCNSKEAPLAIVTNKVLGGNLDNCLYILKYRYNKTPWDSLFLGGQCMTFSRRINYVLVDRAHNTQ